MKIWLWIVVVLVAIVAALGADEEKKPKWVFSTLKVGQQVTLRQEQSGFMVSYFDDDMVPLTHKIIEIGDDFFVVEDIAATRETTVPIYALRSIEMVKTKAK